MRSGEGAPYCDSDSEAPSGATEFSPDLSGSRVRPLPPAPCRRGDRGRGNKRGWGPLFPGLLIEGIGTGFAVGYYLPPLPGLVRLTSRITGTGG
jgi:hypothetical protein